MNRQDAFAIWSPEGAAWSAWVKPVLFAHAHLAGAPAASAPALPEVTWAPAADGQTALVIDLPGASGVWMGMALAAAGYHPVPLYNAAPGPLGDVREGVPISVVNVWEIVAALVSAGPALQGMHLPPEAPPAFLLDADRRRGSGSPVAGRFDNRSVSMPSDFPSANQLLQRGIRRAVLVQATGQEPESDLAHTLLRWQETGLEILVKPLSAQGPPVECEVQEPSFYRSIWHRLIARIGLQRTPLGGFGGMLDETTSG